MTRFQLSLIATLLASAWWLAQLAASFPIVRTGCILILLSYFIAIGIDALIDKAKAESQGYYGELLAVISPHIGYATVILFAIIVGSYVGWV